MKWLGFAGLVLLTAWPAHARAGENLHERASAALAAMTGNAQRVQGLLRTARASRVASEIQCVDASLSRVDAAVRSGRDESRSLELALGRGDAEGAGRAFVALLGYREASRAAAVAADACFGGVSVVPAEGTVVTFVVDPTLPSDRAVFGR